MRKNRLLSPDARYHVTARTVHKSLWLDDDSTKELFLKVVERAHEKYEFRIENFCVMGNHIHLIIQPKGNSNLSVIMKWILGVFAQSFNRLHGFWGHFWGDRFQSRILDGLAEILRISTYIDENPVKAELVTCADEWRFGGLWHFQHGIRAVLCEVPAWLATL